MQKLSINCILAYVKKLFRINLYAHATKCEGLIFHKIEDVILHSQVRWGFLFGGPNFDTNIVVMKQDKIITHMCKRTYIHTYIHTYIYININILILE